MLTVPEAARRTGKNPETIRRWIRAGRLRSEKVGTQHLVDEADLARLTDRREAELPPAFLETRTGEPAPDWVDLIREVRDTR
jgi:excisionase family DNA binding protein